MGGVIFNEHIAGYKTLATRLSDLRPLSRWAAARPSLVARLRQLVQLNAQNNRAAFEERVRTVLEVQGRDA